MGAMGMMGMMGMTGITKLLLALVMVLAVFAGSTAWQLRQQREANSQLEVRQTQLRAQLHLADAVNADLAGTIERINRDAQALLAAVAAAEAEKRTVAQQLTEVRNDLQHTLATPEAAPWAQTPVPPVVADRANAILDRLRQRPGAAGNNHRARGTATAAAELAGRVHGLP